MPAYLEGTTLDTSSIEYSKTGIRLLKFVKTVYENDVFEQIEKGDLIVWFNSRELEYDDHFRDNRVHVSTHVNVKNKDEEGVVQTNVENTEDNLDEGGAYFMKNKINEKPKDEMFVTRNKAIILYSKLFGAEKTNNILEKAFSNNVASKLLEAEKHGFQLINKEDTIKGIALFKKFDKIGVDIAKCQETYWVIVRENLLKYYDEETIDAIIEHYKHVKVNLSPGMDGIMGFADKSGDCEGIWIDFDLCKVKENSKIEKKVGHKEIKYIIDWEEISSALIESHIQLFGDNF